MNHQQVAFRRKLIYLSIMAALLIPLSVLGLPSRGDAAPTSDQRSYWQVVQGWRVLANLREREGITQASLGKIDPLSDTMRFATFGMQGVAMSKLWSDANEHRMKKRWTELGNALDQIGRLQPHFVKVWQYQGWNQSYNVSAEQDDYRYRYKYVVQGISYLHLGRQYNRSDTRLVWDEAWTTAQKMGKADERLQFRRLFRDREWFVYSVDGQEKGYMPPPNKIGDRTNPPDNWLYGKEVFLEAVDMADHGAPLLGRTEIFYRSEPAKCQMRYAADLLKDGPRTDDDEGVWERGRLAWQTAGDEWSRGEQSLGEYKFRGRQGRVYQLNDVERYNDRIKELRAEMDRLEGVDDRGNKTTGLALRQRREAERIQSFRDKLHVTERDLLDKPLASLSDDELAKRKDLETKQATEKITKAEEVANLFSGSTREAARKLADLVSEQLLLSIEPDHQGGMIQYRYWKRLCEAESSAAGVQARKMLYEVSRAAAKDPKSPTVLQKYNEAFAQWRKVLDQFPELIEDGDVGDDIVPEVRKYREVCMNNGQPFIISRFILRDVVNARPQTPPLKDWLSPAARDAKPATDGKAGTNVKPSTEKPSNDKSGSEPKPGAKPSDAKPTDTKPSADAKPATDAKKP